MCVCVCAIVKWSERGKVKEGKREIKGMRERGEKERREREREFNYWEVFRHTLHHSTDSCLPLIGLVYV